MPLLSPKLLCRANAKRHYFWLRVSSFLCFERLRFCCLAAQLLRKQRLAAAPLFPGPIPVAVTPLPLCWGPPHVSLGTGATLWMCSCGEPRVPRGESAAAASHSPTVLTLLASGWATLSLPEKDCCSRTRDVSGPQALLQLDPRAAFSVPHECLWQQGPSGKGPRWNCQVSCFFARS